MRVSQKELAGIFRRTPRTIQRWDAEGLDRARDSDDTTYDLAKAVAWRIEKEGSAGSELDAAKLRKLEAEAESKEMDLQVKRGELVPIDDVDRLLRASLESVHSVVRHSPSRLAPKLAKRAKIPVKSARAILQEIVEMVRGSIREDRKSA